MRITSISPFTRRLAALVSIAAIVALAAMSYAQSASGRLSPPPEAPPGFAPVLKPSANGGYWILVPVGSPAQEPGPAASTEPPLAAAPTAPPPAVEPVPQGWSKGESAEPGPFDAVELERATLDLINEHRIALELPPLQPHPALVAAARSHSDDMTARDYFAHDSPEGQRFVDRIKAQGIVDFGKGAENILKGSAGLESTTLLEAAQTFVQGWLESDGHRENIEDGEFALTGIGVSVGSEFIYATQVFAGRIKLAE